MSMSLQRVKNAGQKGDESFGTDAVGSVPGQKQRVLDFPSILARTCVRWYVQHVLGMIEQPHSIAAMIAGGLYKGIQQHTFLGRRGLTILRGELLEQFASALKIDSFSHVCLLRKSP